MLKQAQALVEGRSLQSRSFSSGHVDVTTACPFLDQRAEFQLNSDLSQTFSALVDDDQRTLQRVLFSKTRPKHRQPSDQSVCIILFKYPRRNTHNAISSNRDCGPHPPIVALQRKSWWKYRKEAHKAYRQTVAQGSAHGYPPSWPLDRGFRLSHLGIPS